MSYNSLNFDGTVTSYLSVPSASLSFGTNDFTIEWWQYENDQNNFPRVFSIGSHPNAAIAFDREYSGIYYWNQSNYNYYPLTEPYLDTWIHYAIVRTSGMITIYLNGQALSPSFAEPTNYSFTENLVIGNETSPLLIAAFKGQIYNFMWLIGTAKYTSNFTPSTNLPTNSSMYALVLNGSYFGGALKNDVTIVGVTPSSNTPYIPPTPGPTFSVNPYQRYSSISFGQFWYGNSTNFPGFLYKKNVGVGGRRSTKFGAGGNIYCNKSRHIFNKYKPGVNGVGASTIANRRAKNRLASVCGGRNSQCGPFYQYLGRYNNYTENPNGYFPYPTL